LLWQPKMQETTAEIHFEQCSKVHLE